MKNFTPETKISNSTGEAVLIIHDIRTRLPNSSKRFIKNYLKTFEFMFVNGYNLQVFLYVTET